MSRGELKQQIRLAAALASIDSVRLDADRVHSNIIRFEVDADSGSVATRLHERGVYMLPNGAHGMRAVLHRDLTDDDVDAALSIIEEVLAEHAAGVS